MIWTVLVLAFVLRIAAGVFACELEHNTGQFPSQTFAEGRVVNRSNLFAYDAQTDRFYAVYDSKYIMRLTGDSVTRMVGSYRPNGGDPGADGAYATATFSRITTMYYSAAGNKLIVIDNGRLRAVWLSSATVTTIAGTHGANSSVLTSYTYNPTTNTYTAAFNSTAFLISETSYNCVRLIDENTGAATVVVGTCDSNSSAAAPNSAYWDMYRTTVNTTELSVNFLPRPGPLTVGRSVSGTSSYVYVAPLDGMVVGILGFAVVDWIIPQNSGNTTTVTSAFRYRTTSSSARVIALMAAEGPTHGLRFVTANEPCSLVELPFDALLYPVTYQTSGQSAVPACSRTLASNDGGPLDVHLTLDPTELMMIFPYEQGNSIFKLENCGTLVREPERPKTTLAAANLAPSGDLSTGAIAAISVSAAVVFLGAVGGVCFLLAQKRKKERAKTRTAQDAETSSKFDSSRQPFEYSDAMQASVMTTVTSPHLVGRGAAVMLVPTDIEVLKDTCRPASRGTSVVTVANDDVESPQRVSSPIEVSVSAEIARRDKRCREKIARGQWTKERMLGRGATGSVYAVLLSDGSSIAMKELALLGSATDVNRQLAEVRREMDLLSKMRHPHLVAYYGIQEDLDNFTVRIFMELVTGGCVGSLVRIMAAPLDDATARSFAFQSVHALAYIHSRGVVHRDLKCDNILLSKEGTVKLADFGTARCIGTTNATRAATTMVGTPLYMAPEVLCCVDVADPDGGYGTKADIWSLGITIAEMCDQGNAPWPQFASAGHAFMYISGPTGNPTLPAHLSADCRDFIMTCCRREAKDRPSAAELLRHPWLLPLTTAVEAETPHV